MDPPPLARARIDVDEDSYDGRLLRALLTDAALDTNQLGQLVEAVSPASTSFAFPVAPRLWSQLAHLLRAPCFEPLATASENTVAREVAEVEDQLDFLRVLRRRLSAEGRPFSGIGHRLAEVAPH